VRVMTGLKLDGVKTLVLGFTVCFATRIDRAKATGPTVSLTEGGRTEP
jgi:hypothetical protein